jgi:ABC-type uncharacterized transport system auxiliary subunit
VKSSLKLGKYSIKLGNSSLKLLLLCACALSNACALTSRSEPMQIRYFSADRVASSHTPVAIARGPAVSLRLDRVRSSSHLGEAIAYRTGIHELGYYDEERWTERPEAFLERGLERALFQDQGVTRVVGGISETLSVELVSFEEVRGDRPVARVEVGLTLHDERSSQLEQTIVVERPIGPHGTDRAASAVSALSEAMSEAIDRIAQTVTERLRVIAAADPPARQPAEAAAAR